MRPILSALLLPVVFFSGSARASPQWREWGDTSYWNPDPSSRGSNSGSSDPSSPAFSFPGVDPSSSAFTQRNQILVAHAVLASAAWAFFFPVGAILLRLNIHHPVMLRLHILFQIFAYVVFVAAAGMGIWLAVQAQPYFDVWGYAHPIIGLVILALATIQPFTGWIHHRIFRSRARASETTDGGPRPGRTAWGRWHLWLGRGLITLAIINGGLGLKILEDSPFQPEEVTRNAEIGYGVAAGSIWCIYVFVTLLWEVRRSARRRKEEQTRAQPRSGSRSRETRAKSQSSSGESSFEMSESPSHN